MRRLLRPLDDIRAGALRFGAGDFAQPIPVRHPARPDELGELAATINTMGGDIRQMLDAKRALLLAISHELRSPLTRARLNTELLPETPDVQPARDALLRDLGQMRDLITDLLESERLASPHAALHLEPVDLAALVGEVVASLDGAPTVQQTFAANLPTPMLDRTRMRLLLRNLLDNALRHSADAPLPPEISVQTEPADPHPGKAPPSASPCATTAPACPTTSCPTWPSPSTAPTPPASAPPAAWAWACTCASWWRRRTAARFTVRNARPGLEVVVTLPD